MRHLLACALVLGAGLSAPASAQSSGTIAVPVPGFTFFNRPGATMDAQRADLDSCRVSVGALSQLMPSAATTTVGGLTGAAMDDQARIVATLKAMHVNYENCMVARGWRVMQLDPALGEELDNLEPEALASRLAPMVGAEAPEARVMRSFGNEVAERSTELYAFPRSVETTSLSLQLLPETYLQLPSRRRTAPMGAMTSEQIAERARERREMLAAARAQGEALAGHRFARATENDEIGALPSDATLVIVRMHGAGGAGLILVRADATENRDDSIAPVVPAPRRRVPREKTYVYAVPPGHWRITAVSPGAGLTSLCLGAPSFDVGQGEVVFAGSFAFGDSGPRLDMSLEPARAALAAAPALAERVRAASYVNGETFECGGGASYLYAYEIDGAPFREGYNLGSRATPGSTEPATASTDAAQQ